MGSLAGTNGILLQEFVESLCLFFETEDTQTADYAGDAQVVVVELCVPRPRAVVPGIRVLFDLHYVNCGKYKRGFDADLLSQSSLPRSI